MKDRNDQYVVATVSGEMPTDLIASYKKAAKALELCRKGWPQKQWKIYGFQLESKKLYPNEEVPSFLRSEISKRFGVDNIVAMKEQVKL